MAWLRLITMIVNLGLFILAMFYGFKEEYAHATFLLALLLVNSTHITGEK